jgi:DNA repair protein SbcD/Mre11
MSFTFVHAADIHLDSPLRGLERYESAPADRMRLATRGAFENLVQYCVTEKIDFLLLAGDLYDGDWRDYNTGHFFLRQMGILRDAGIPVFIVWGNHDAENAMTRKLSALENMHVFPSKMSATERLEELNVSIHGQSYGRKDVSDDLSAGYPSPDAGCFNIGMLHTSADGRSPEHARYAPCSIETLVDKGYGYWALGHVHNRDILRVDPHVVFPGNLQGRFFRETGPKGATVVRVSNGRVTLEEHHFDVLRWDVCQVSVADVSSPDAAIDRVYEALAGIRHRTPEVALAVRMRLTGVSRAHAALVANQERWINEARLRAADLRDLWVETVEIDTRSPVDLDALRQRLDHPLGEVLRTIDVFRSDDAALAEIIASLKPIQDRFPTAQDFDPGALHMDQPETIRALLDDVEQMLVPRLLESGDQE